MKIAVLLFTGAVALTGVSSGASAMNVSFSWGKIPRCTTGNPGTVPSPAFKISGAPTGTAKLSFSMRDNQVPGFRHGGGSVAYSGGSVAAGAFSYKSPCPPSGSHTYTWTVTAYDKAGKKLGTAQASKQYP